MEFVLFPVPLRHRCPRPLKDGVEYKDLGTGHFARRDCEKLIQRLVRRINDLGCDVQLLPKVA